MHKHETCLRRPCSGAVWGSVPPCAPTEPLDWGTSEGPKVLGSNLHLKAIILEILYTCNALPVRGVEVGGYHQTCFTDGDMVLSWCGCESRLPLLLAARKSECCAWKVTSGSPPCLLLPRSWTPSSVLGCHSRGSGGVLLLPSFFFFCYFSRGHNWSLLSPGWSEVYLGVSDGPRSAPAHLLERGVGIVLSAALRTQMQSPPDPTYFVPAGSGWMTQSSSFLLWQRQWPPRPGGSEEVFSVKNWSGCHHFVSHCKSNPKLLSAY